jgi:hypothetical protein
MSFKTIRFTVNNYQLRLTGGARSGQNSLQLQSLRHTTGIKDTSGKFTASVVDTGGKFATGVVDTGIKFSASVVVTGGKFATGFVDTYGAS